MEDGEHMDPWAHNKCVINTPTSSALIHDTKEETTHSFYMMTLDASQGDGGFFRIPKTKLGCFIFRKITDANMLKQALGSV